MPVREAPSRDVKMVGALASLVTSANSGHATAALSGISRAGGAHLQT